MDIKVNLLKRHWNIIYLLPMVCGILAIVLSVVFNPVFVARYVSSDHRLEGRTITNIYLLEVLIFFVGLALIVLARFLRVHNERKERIVTNFLILCGSTLFMLVLMEIALKAVNRYIKPFNRQRHAFFQYDEVLGWTHTPNKIAFFKNARVEINARGLRDDEVPYQKPAGEFRILFLGDSQLFGDGVSSEETFTSLLEAEFNDVQAINAGIIGYGTDQQLLFLKKEGMKYSPDLIVVALNAYDFQDNVSKTIRSGYAKPLFKIEGDELRLTNVPVPKFDIIERMNRRFRNMSHLYYFTSMGLGRTVNRGSGGTRQRYDPGSILLKAAQLENAVRVTKKILKGIAQVGQNVNAKTVVVFLPYEMDFGSDSNYKNQINQISQKLDTYSRENDFLFLDIRADLAASSHTNIYLDSMHFNSVGHKIVAEVLAENLMKFNLIPKVHIK